MTNVQEVSEAFPHKMGDDELAKTIAGYMNQIIKSGSQENIVIQCYPLVALGQHELERRQTRRITRNATVVSFTSLFVAAVALAISVINTAASSRWEERQIKSLDSLQTTMSSVNINLRELLAATKNPVVIEKSNVQVPAPNAVPDTMPAVNTSAAPKKLQ